MEHGTNFMITLF